MTVVEIIIAELHCLSNDGHLPPEIPQIDGRDSFNSVSHRSLVVSFEVPDRTTTYIVVIRDGGVLCGRCDFLCYVCVVASVAAASNDRHWTNYRCAGVQLTAPRRRPRRSAAEMCGWRQADADPHEFLRSVDSRGRLARKFEDAY